MAVAHEFDPYNNDWVSRWNRAEIREPWIDMVRRLYSEGKLYPIRDIVESESFWEHVAGEEERIAYPEAGMFTAYLIEEYGLTKMKRIYGTLQYSDSLEAIQDQFMTTYGHPIDQLEADWLNTLGSEGLGTTSLNIEYHPVQLVPSNSWK
jgi:hypothetical protein